MVCESMGGFLAEDTSDDINAFLSDLVAQAQLSELCLVMCSLLVFPSFLHRREGVIIVKAS